MPANCTKTPENHGGEVFQLEHSFSDLWMILKAAKGHSSGHVGIICQQGLGSACALVLWRPGLGQLQSQREKAESVLGHQVIQTETAGRVVSCLFKTVYLQDSTAPAQRWKSFDSGPSQEAHSIPVPLLEDKLKTPSRVAACGAINS